MDSLTLQDVLHTLEQQGKLIAFDMGEHAYCKIDSNCPRAVELRKITADMGVDYKTLPRPTEEASTNLLAVDFQPITTQVMIGNTPVDASALIREEAMNGIRILINQAETTRSQVARLGKSYNSTYNQRVQELRKQGRLPQVAFNLSELVKYNCTITADAEGKHYLFCFGIQYHPQWTYHNGVRCEINPEYAKRLERNVWLVFKIAKNRIIVTTQLLMSDGKKFQHYHGNEGGDCWGQNERLHDWDGTLKQLGDKAITLSRALATVNMDSLLNRSPEGFPLPAELQKHTRVLGEEGRTAAQEEANAPARPRTWRDI
jgi:hypothetical protein